MPQRQVDWAEKKASQFDWLDHDTIVQIAHALRLERARAVRVCKGQKWTNPAIVISNCGGGYEYNQACDDCAGAIKGKP